MRSGSEYKKNDIQSSDSVRIISLLLDGAVDFTRMAMVKLKENDMANKGLYISRATAIISELLSSLDLEKGEKIASNLRGLYEFILDRLLSANMKNDPGCLGEALKVIETLRDGWKELEKKNAGKTLPKKEQEQKGKQIEVRI